MSKPDMKNIIIILCVCLAVVLVASAFQSLQNSLNVPLVNEPTQNELAQDKPVDNEQMVDFSTLKYLAFGDSITSGGNLENESESYPWQTAKLLHCSVLNNAVSGSTLSYIDIRRCIANDVVDFSKNGQKYDIISVMGGTNDKSRSLPLGVISDSTVDSVYGSLNIIAETLTSVYPDAFVFFLTPIPNYASEQTNSLGYTLEDVVIAVKAVAEKYGIAVLDMYKLSGFETVDSGLNNVNCDGTHPIKEFVSEYMAPQIAQFIRNNYNK